MPATLTRDALTKEPGAAERGRGRPSTAARGGVPTSNAGMARLARDGGAARANLVGAGGNRLARSTLAVSHPGDPAEREAEALASRVAHGASPPAALARTPEPAVARALVSRDDAPAPADDVAAGGDVEVSTAVSSLIASPGAGAPMDPAVQAKVEPHLGADLGAVRVHQGPEVGAAAAELHARAFTVGADIFLGEGESSADLELMAHEATHVVQQQAVAVYRDLEVTDLLPDFIIDGVTSAAREIPGYTLLTVITGKDPLTDEPATVSRTEFVEKLLTFGPFGAAVGPLLQTIDVLGDIVTLLMDALAAHNLTLSRIGHDISAAWDEMGITEGIDGNVAIVERYVDAIVADIRAFVSDVIDAVVAKVREVVADVAEPLLQRPEIAPYWNLAKKVFHHDPLRDEDVSAPTVEILGDFLKLAGRDEVLAQMTERGTLQETADWLDQQWATFTDLLSRTGALFADAWAAISPENLPNLIENITSLADRAFTLLQDVGAFASTILLKVLELVKKSLLGWASEHAHKVPGFHLLTVILERNPFTGEAVPRTAENLIKGFITLLPGGEAMYDELAESGVIGDAAATIESAMTRLNISWDLITGTFLGIWNTVTLESLLSPIETFDRIVAAFGDPLNRIAEFVSVVIQVVIRLILELMNFPSELLGNIIANATAAIEDIKNDPVGFLKNVVAAMKAGFEGFFGNIATYLLEGLSGWLFRGLRGLGIEPPTSLSVENIITLVIQVLGVTTETLWTKLGERIGPERVVQIRAALDHLSGAWTFIKDVQERGITAVWEFIQGQLSNLWDTILTTAKDWIMREIVDRVVTRLLSMLDPTGVMAVINGTIAFFNAVQSAIDYLRELLEIVDQYVSTIASVARGDVAPGAAMLERGLASAVPVAIGFLANQVGLGNVPEKVQEIIVGLRELVDQALDWLFDQAMALGRAALDALTGAGGAEGEDTPESRAVKDKARQRLQERTQQPFATRAELQAVLDAVLVELRPEGLVDVSLQERPDAPGRYKISVAASPAEEVDEAVVGPAGPVSEAARAALTKLYPLKEQAVVDAELAALAAEGLADDELVRAVNAAYDALIDREKIVQVLVDIHREAAGANGAPIEPIRMRVVRPGGPTSETAELSLDQSDPAQAFLAALLRMSSAAAGPESEGRFNVTVILSHKKLSGKLVNFDGAIFFQDVVSQGFRFLDVAIVENAKSAEHGAATHLIQDLVVDKALRAAGIAMTADALRRRITNKMWGVMYDQMTQATIDGVLTEAIINDPNQLYPALREFTQDLDAVLKRGDRLLVSGGER